MNSKVRSLSRNDFTYRLAIPTRWDDNDMLGHLNNVLYYRFLKQCWSSLLLKKLIWIGVMVF